MASVTLREIRKTYEDRDRGRKGQTVDVIKGVDLSIGDGEFLVLVGPSGCGKSTLLRMIAGLEDITSGALSIGDRVVNDVPPKDRGIGMVFQSYALYPHMTVRENMAFGLKLRKTEASIITARVEEAARQLDLTAYLERLPKQLSGGQRQRVAIGRAIVRQPEVFLFDEPLSNLDAALRNQMRIELKKLHLRLGSTMIYVTHDQVEAMTLADRIAILNKGVVQQIGTPAEVFDTPANRFVASFIGSPGMNFLSGAVERGVFDGDGFSIPVGDTAGVDAIGVRPQHLHLADADAETPAGWGRLDAELDVVEPMGWEALLHMRAGTHALIAHVEMDQARGLRPGDRLALVVEPEHLHAFGEDGRRIALPSQARAEEEE